jgi:hypothetical protein
MRTTVDLDPELLAQLRREAQRAKIPFTRLVNRVLRRGLAAPASALPSLDEVFPVRPLRVREGIALDRARAIADELEDQELLHKPLGT